MKLLLPDSRLGPETFADLHLPQGAGSSALLVYIGGAVSSRVYAARRASPPDDVLTLLAGFPRPCRALVLSYAPALPGRPAAAAEAFLGHFRDELLPRLPVSADRLSVVEFSLGAALAVLLARAAGARVVALSTVGAVGAAEALAHVDRALGPLSCPVFVAWNADDPCGPHSVRFAGALGAAGVAHETVNGAGGHAFSEYVESGLMGSAVEFAVGGLCSES